MNRHSSQLPTLLATTAVLATLHAVAFVAAAGRWPLSSLYFVLVATLAAGMSALLGVALDRLRCPWPLALGLWVLSGQLLEVRWWVWRLDGPTKVVAAALPPALALGLALILAHRRAVRPWAVAVVAAGATSLATVVYPRWALRLPWLAFPSWMDIWVAPNLLLLAWVVGWLSLLRLEGARARRLAVALALLLPPFLALRAGLGEWRFTMPEVPAATATEVPERPSILLLVLDTVRADRLSLYGYGRDTTAALERRFTVPGRAAAFPRAYANGNWTVPSHGSLLTGALPSEHGAEWVAAGDERRVGVLSPAVATLPELLKPLGYRSHGIVANPQLIFSGGLGRGFERFVLPAPVEGLPGLGEALRRLIVPGLYPEALWMHAPVGRINTLVLETLAGCGAAPCFVLANYFEPHALYAPASTCRGRFAPWSLAEPIEHPLLALPPSRLARLSTRYDEEICGLASGIAELLDALTVRGFRRRGWIFLVSDHGEAFGEHGVTEHGTSLYDEQVRVPLVALPPEGETLLPSAEPVDLLDVAATLAAIAGHELHGRGRDLRRPLATRPVPIEAAGDPGKAPFCGPRAAEPGRAVVYGRFKLIEQASRRELYDLVADPMETRDLASARPEVVALLAPLLPAGTPATTPPTTSGPELTPEARRALEALGYVH